MTLAYPVIDFFPALALGGVCLFIGFVIGYGLGYGAKKDEGL